MKITSKEIVQNWVYILIIMVVGFFFVGIYILVSGNKLTREATDSFYEYNLEDKKRHLQTEVLNRIDEIKYERNNLLEDEKIKLNTRIHGIYNFLVNSDAAYLDESGEKLKMIISTFEELITEDKDYLYFVIDTDGVMMRSGTDQNIVGTNLYDAKDIEGTYFIRDIIEAKENPEGTYVDYYWPKSKEGEPLKKTSYCLYLPEFDIIIGTGVYHDDIQTQLQNRIYARLQSYYEDKADYIFVDEFDSTARVAGDRNLLGTKISDVTTFDGESIHDVIMSLIQNDGEGFLTYKINRRDDSVLSEKISYVHILEEWDAYIGMGFYIDDLNEEVERYSVLFKEHYYNQALYVLIGLMLIAILVFAVYQRGAYMQKMFLKQGDLIFEELFHLSNEAIIILSLNGRLLFENEVASRLFHNQTNNYIISGDLGLSCVNENIYTFETDNNRVYYVNLRKENVSFRSMDSIIYFISDITIDYLKSNSFEEMAYHDELTGLFNRRALRDTYEDLSYDLQMEENYILGFIDIDMFKIVNDTYGHSVGDEVIKILGNTFTKRLRSKDAFYRYGGEEFVVLLKNISIEHAKGLIEDLNKLFCEQVITEIDISCTYSAGLIEINYNNKETSLSNHIAQADKLLYQAKLNGRNRVEI